MQTTNSDTKLKPSWSPIAIFLLCLLMLVSLYFGLKNILGPYKPTWFDRKSNSQILVHNFEGVIIDSRKWIEKVDKEVQKTTIKGMVLVVNSPGGIVAPSQELYAFLKKVRDEYKKPVIVFSNGLLASGAYYLALGASEIWANSGAMIGSIGVVMEFANLEELYSWAKVKRFALTSGKFKDSGSGYRTMRDDERALFQSLIDEIYGQFKDAVRLERKLSEDVLTTYCDGRVFTGNKAKELGFIDHVGTLDQAIEALAEKVGASKDDIYRIPKEKRFKWDLIFDDEDAESRISNLGQAVLKQLQSSLRLELAGQPLYLYPGTY